jgi:integrase
MKFNLTSDKGNYRIDFSLNGKRKRFYPGTKDETTAKQIHKQMAYEWEMGQFDLSLDRYRLKNRKQQIQAKAGSKKNIPSQKPKLLGLWDKWVDSLNLPARTRNNHYHLCRVMLIKAKDPDWDDVTWFLQTELSGSTWNIRRRFFKSCTNWALQEGLIEGKNPWQSLKPRKGHKSKAKPFTTQETEQIIKAFESDQFCSKYAPCKHSFYTPFLKFLLLTAARPGEVIALQWKHIDFDRGLIDISEAMGRDLDSSPYATRKVRKGTKTEEARYLPLTPPLRKLLTDHKPEFSKPDDLIFPGSKGGVLDTRSFREVWGKVLVGLDLEYRNPYQTRHTSLSNIAQKHGLLAAAKVAGHKTLDMVNRHYAQFTGDLMDVMPDYGEDSKEKNNL